uniref:PpiC domain-containing protein n=1 Tax=Prevotella sp. GTC17259 TaxID=3236795 RepID=A0AB33J637_9BACT
MRRTPSALLLVGMLLTGSMVFGQTADPVVMTINGKAVTRSEFEYSYNKNNAAGVIDKKSVEDYLPLFVDYKLKIEAALDAHLDTLSSFRSNLAAYCSGQARPAMVSGMDVEVAARSLYEDVKRRTAANGGLYKVAQIYLHVGQRAPRSAEMAARQRIDSIYRVLQRGDDFAALARRSSEDKRSAARGGELPWMQRGEMLAEVETAMLALKVGEMSRPFESPSGFHIIKLIEKRDFLPYDSVHADLLKWVERQNVRKRMTGRRIRQIVETLQTDSSRTMDDRRIISGSRDFLMQEYRDGLLLYDICSRRVWDSAARDEAGLERYFRKNKKKYRWGQPRYKGIAYYAKTKKELKAVKKLLKTADFNSWADMIKRTFSQDGVTTVRARQGLFKPGDDLLVDAKVFGNGVGRSATVEGYPYMAVYGKKLKAPKSIDDVRHLVVADYQEEREKDWVNGLRKKYTVSIDRDVLQTVNKH